MFEAVDPDFVIFPTYKWLLGPYGRAFLYMARRHQRRHSARADRLWPPRVRSDAEVYFADTGYVDGARRFDMGERDHFISMEMASIGMEMMAEWGMEAIEERLAMLTARIADGLSRRICPTPHHGCAVSCAAHPEPWLCRRPAGRAGRGPGGEGIHVAARLSRMRLSPHVFNDEEDADRFVAALKKRL